MEKAAFRPPFRITFCCLLAGMPPAILAAEPGAGGADKTVAAGIFVAADRGGRDGSRRADSAADDPSRDIARPEAAVIVPTIIAAAPVAVPIGLIAIDLIAIGLALVAAGIGVSGAEVLAIGV